MKNNFKQTFHTLDDLNHEINENMHTTNELQTAIKLSDLRMRDVAKDKYS